MYPHHPDSFNFCIFVDYTRKRRIFNDKLSVWAAEKVNVSEIQKKKHETTLKAEEEILKVRLERERLLTNLMAEEIKLRMKCQTEKHESEMDLLDLQKKKIRLSMNLSAN